jgi:hypothetical protein
MGGAGRTPGASTAAAALVVAVEERMNSFVLWIIATAAAQALACFTVSYGTAALFLRRQNRKRRVQLRNRLQLRV